MFVALFLPLSQAGTFYYKILSNVNVNGGCGSQMTVLSLPSQAGVVFYFDGYCC